MNLSTFNFSQWFRAHPNWAILLMTLPLIALVGGTKYGLDDTIGLSQKTVEDTFWVNKTFYPHPVEAIILGDSRTYRGVSPQVMETILPCLSILNFGYSSGGLNSTVYAEADKKLNGDYSPKIVILGISPVALTPERAENRHLQQELNRPRDYVMLHRYADQVAQFMEPIPPLALLGTIYENNQSRYIYEYHPKGWVASQMIPENPNKIVIWYNEVFDNNQVSTTLINDLLHQTATWREQGVLVFGFRPPTTAEMVAVENRLSGFNEADFRQKFATVGGIWIPLAIEDYHSYDGSHLDKNSAIKLSQDLAQFIQAYLTQHYQPCL